MSFQCAKHKEFHKGRVFLMHLNKEGGDLPKNIPPLFPFQPPHKKRLTLLIIALHVDYSRIKVFLLCKVFKYYCLADPSLFCYLPCRGAFEAFLGKKTHGNFYNLCIALLCSKPLFSHFYTLTLSAVILW